MKLSVPYYSQFVDIDDPFWMLRACGAVSLKMVLEYHGKNVPDILTLCNEAKEKGGYDMTNGWVHDYLVQKAKDFGLQSERKENMESFGWGVDKTKEQLLVKLAHETAHAFQNQSGHETALVNFLNGSNNIDEKSRPYLELYALLNAKGVCNGLADMNIYHKQSSTTGLLDVTTLEDITEFIGAYLISDEYFNFRLDGSRTPLSKDEKNKISTLVVQIVRE